MLRLVAAQAETLWDEALPIEVRQLPEDLAALDELLCDPALLAPFVACWEREALVSGVSAADHGRPTLAIETYVRLMVLKHRHGWGYRSAGRGGFGLDSPAPLLPDRAFGAGARRVDGAQADQTDRRADRQRRHARADRGSGSRAALSGAGGQDRLDGDRGRHQVSDRRGPGVARRPLAGAGGPQAGREARARRRPRCATARVRWAASCAQSPARSAGAAGRRRPRCWR